MSCLCNQHSSDSSLPQVLLGLRDRDWGPGYYSCPGPGKDSQGLGWATVSEHLYEPGFAPPSGMPEPSLPRVGWSWVLALSFGKHWTDCLGCLLLGLWNIHPQFLTTRITPSQGRTKQEGAGRNHSWATVCKISGYFYETPTLSPIETAAALWPVRGPIPPTICRGAQAHEQGQAASGIVWGQTQAARPEGCGPLSSDRPGSRPKVSTSTPQNSQDQQGWGWRWVEQRFGGEREWVKEEGERREGTVGEEASLPPLWSCCALVRPHQMVVLGMRWWWR